MSRFIILCLMLAGLTATSQKRLTSYITEGKVGRVFFKEVNGVNYSITIGADDIVLVSKIVDNGDPVLLSSRKLQGIGKSQRMMIYGSKIVLPDDIGIDIYDFLSHSTNSMVMASGSLIKGEKVVLGNEYGCVVKSTVINGFDKPNIYMGYNYIWEEFLKDFEPTYLAGRYVFGNKNIGSSKREYYVWNSTNRKYDILIDVTSKYFGFDVVDDKAYYLDNSDEIFYYDLNSYKRKNTGIFSSNDKIYKQVLVKGDEVFIYQGTSDSMYLEKFNLASKEKLSTMKFAIKGGIDNKNFHWRNNHLLYRTLSGELGAIDIVNRTKTSIKASSEYQFIDFPIVDDRYIVAQEDKVIKYLDIETGEIITSEPSNDGVRASSPGIIKVNGQIWTSFVRSNTLQSSIYSVDTNLKVIEPLEIAQIIKSGLHENSRFVKYKGNVVVSAQNMYQFDGEITKELNDEPVNVHKYRHSQVVLGDRLFYHSVSNDSLHLHQVRNGVDSLMLSIPEPYDINIFGVTNRYFYYFDLDSKFFQVDLKTHQQTRITQVENPLSLIGSIISFDNCIYVTGDSELHKLNDDGTHEYLQNFTDYNGYLIEGENNYFTKDRELYLCTRDSLVPLALNLPTEITYHQITGSDDLVFSANQGRQLVHVSGKQVAILPYDTINPNNKLNIANLGINFAIIKDTYSELYVLDYKRQLFTNVGDLPIFKDKRICSAFIMNGDTLMLVRTKSMVHTYQAKNYFKDFTLRHLVDFGFETNVFEISTLSDFGLLQTQYAMYYISKTGELIMLPDLISSVASRYFTGKNDDHIYFFGINTAHGRQVYSLSKNALSSIFDEERMDALQKITLYPNPAQHEISIKGLETHTLYHMQMYNANGQIVKQGLMVPAGFDISDIQRGTYFVKIKDHDRAIFLPFVKL